MEKEVMMNAVSSEEEVYKWVVVVISEFACLAEVPGELA